MAEGSLVNLNIGALAAPVEKLIDRVSDAVGGIVRPWQIERVAKAEGKAEILRAEARITVSEIEQRAMHRLVREEGKKQENIESITAKSTSKVLDSAKPEDIEEDWLTNFFDRCRSVSDDEMQQIWANILAGEANNPGRFDKKTIDLLSTMGKADAQNFQKLARFVVFFPRAVPLIFDHNADIYKDNGCNFEYFNLLQDLGLVNFNFSVGYNLTIVSGSTILRYSNRFYSMSFDSNNFFDVGQVILTRACMQIIELCSDIYDEEFEHYFIENLLKQNILVSSINNLSVRLRRKSVVCVLLSLTKEKVFVTLENLYARKLVSQQLNNIGIKQWHSAKKLVEQKFAPASELLLRALQQDLVYLYSVAIAKFMPRSLMIFKV
jgi:hypothetical protein